MTISSDTVKIREIHHWATANMDRSSAELSSGPWVGVLRSDVTCFLSSTWEPPLSGTCGASHPPQVLWCEQFSSPSCQRQPAGGGICAFFHKVISNDVTLKKYTTYAIPRRIIGNSFRLREWDILSHCNGAMETSRKTPRNCFHLFVNRVQLRIYDNTDTSQMLNKGCSLRTTLLC